MSGRKAQISQTGVTAGPVNHDITHYTSDNEMTNKTNQRYGVKPVDSRRTGVVPGSPPRRSPPKRSGGTKNTSTENSRQARDKYRKSKKEKTKEVPLCNEEKQEEKIRIIQWNAEGIMNKKAVLTQKLHTDNIDVACIQETHLKENNRFSVRGYQCYRQDRPNQHKGGILILIKNDIPTSEISVDTNEQAEHQGVNIAMANRQIKIYNSYCPPNKSLSLEKLDIPDDDCIVTGDFNSHSQSWGYDQMDARGEEVEHWQIDNKLQLLNTEDDIDTFYSRRWKSTSTPDLAFCTDNLSPVINRTVLPQLGGSDHRPILIELKLGRNTTKTPTLPRWNYKKANWTRFTELTDIYTSQINCKTRNINKMNRLFNNAILKAARESVPRGARKNYVPYWSEELEQLHNKVSEARNEAEMYPSEENAVNLNQAEEELKEKTKTRRREAWQEKTRELDFDKNGNKLWKLTRSLNSEPNKCASIPLEDEKGRILGTKEAANTFVQQFQKIGDIHIDRQRKKEVNAETIALKRNLKEPEDDIMVAPLKLEEMNQALKCLKSGKSPGPDGVSNEMLLHLGKIAKKKMLQLLNKSWKTKTVPQSWRKATLIPIHKNGKPRHKADSYRPISLTSCICKLMERILNNRLLWYLEKENIIMKEQAGFRRSRSTEDQIAYISQEIEDAFQEKKHTAIVWVDMEKAFDKVWKKGVLLKMLRHNISHNMYGWIEQFLFHRKARVSLQGEVSRQARIQHGVPQGGVLSPTLFIIFMNDIQQTLCQGVKAAMYADDLALISSDQNAGSAGMRLQIALNKLQEWTSDWCMSVNAQKTTYTIFSLSPKLGTLKLSIGDQQLQREDHPKYLGVRFDPKLTWKHQVDDCQKKGLKRTALLKKLAGTTWGANLTVLKKAYVGYVRPVMEYGLAAWGTCSKTQLQKLKKVENQNLRLITGGMKTTPIAQMEGLTGLHSIEDRKEGKLLNQYTNVKSIEHHPMHERAKKPVKNRLKRTSFLQTAKSTEDSLKIPPIDSLTLNPVINSCPPWKRHTMPVIETEITEIGGKQHDSEDNIKHIVMKLLERKYPSKKWTHVYTDGSVTEERYGGAGVYIQWPDGKSSKSSMPAGEMCLATKAEAVALQNAFKQLANEESTYDSKLVFLTDSLTVLTALKDPKTTEFADLIKPLVKLNELAQEVTLQWIPGHCDIPGNETADKLAREGSRMIQNKSEITHAEMKNHIKVAILDQWKERHPNHVPRDSILELPREDQVKLFRLRTGHNRLREHMHQKLKVGDTDLCDCGQDLENTNHVLQTCRRYEEQRKRVWPTPTPTKTKLHGNLRELKKTAEFLKNIRICI